LRSNPGSGKTVRDIGFIKNGRATLGPDSRECHERPRHLLHRQHVRDETGLNGTEGHTVVLRGRRLLHQRHPTRTSDGANSLRPIAARPRKDDAGRRLALIFGKRAQEGVDRHALSARLRRQTQLKRTMKNRHVAIGRDHINVPRLDNGLIPSFNHF
jgi:hypothetical protein